MSCQDDEQDPTPEDRPGAPDERPPRASGTAQEQADFEVLARRVIEPVRRYLARRTDPATAGDVLSEVLLVLWRRLDDVPADEPLPWAYTTARHCLQNAQRSAVRQQRLATRVAVLDPPPVGVQDAKDRAESGVVNDGWGVDAEDVRRAVAALSSASAEVVRLWAWEELAPAQIAVMLDTTANAVSVRLHRAKKQLAAALSDPQGPPPAGRSRRNHNQETGKTS